MLDLAAIQHQLQDFARLRAEQEAERSRRLERALGALPACGADWQTLAAYLASNASSSRLHAGLLEPPDVRHAPLPRPAEVTVVSTDGSQIYPDRHVEPTCFLLNIGRVAFHYGTLEAPLMEARPRVMYRATELQDVAGDGYDTATEAVVSALRDELELTELLRLAEAVRVPGRPIVALSDGTLIRWMLRGLRDRALEERLLRAYTDALDGFRDAGIPVCSYISLPANAELVNTLGAGLLRAGEEPDEHALDGVLDRTVFDRYLRPGERSALFATESHIQHQYPEAQRIRFFYLKTDGPGLPEIARVELPAWVAETPGALDLLHSVVLDACRKGQGYPVALAEAHEQAVVRAQDRALFYEMLEAMTVREGTSPIVSRKQAAKRRPLL